MADRFEPAGIHNGLYRIYWKTGGHSLGAIGRLDSGALWFAPVNWVSASVIGIASDRWEKVDHVELFTDDATEQAARNVQDSPPVSTDEPDICQVCYKPIVFNRVAVGYADARGQKFVHFECGNSATEPSLQLLVIDLCDSVIVKVEKGAIQSLGKLAPTGMMGNLCMFQMSFEGVKRSLDALADEPKPVPRIEWCEERLQVVYGEKENVDYRLFDSEAYDALCELAGVQIPVYEGKRGKWERLNTHDWTQAKKDIAKHNEDTGQNYGIQTHSFEEAICPVKIWRFTVNNERIEVKA